VKDAVLVAGSELNVPEKPEADDSIVAMYCVVSPVMVNVTAGSDMYPWPLTSADRDAAATTEARVVDGANIFLRGNVLGLESWRGLPRGWMRAPQGVFESEIVAEEPPVAP
jgi:hypothetical protein